MQKPSALKGATGMAMNWSGRSGREANKGEGKGRTKKKAGPPIPRGAHYLLRHRLAAFRGWARRGKSRTKKGGTKFGSVHLMERSNGKGGKAVEDRRKTSDLGQDRRSGR